MKPDISRFRRLEAILHALLDEEAAELTTTLAGISIGSSSTEPGRIAWQSLVECYRASHETLFEKLRSANDVFSNTFGFNPIASHAFRLHGFDGSFSELDPIDLSSTFISVLDGTIAPHRWVKSKTCRLPDAASRGFIALLHDAAKASDAAFLYRQALDEPFGTAMGDVRSRQCAR